MVSTTRAAAGRLLVLYGRSGRSKAALVLSARQTASFQSTCSYSSSSSLSLLHVRHAQHRWHPWQHPWQHPCRSLPGVPQNMMKNMQWSSLSGAFSMYSTHGSSNTKNNNTTTNNTTSTTTNNNKNRPGRTTIIEPSIRSRPFRYNLRAPPRHTSKRVILNQNYQSTKPGDVYGSYPVYAIHAAQSIDLPKVISKVFAAKGVRKMMERLSVVVQLQPDDHDSTSRFVAVFRFGSVVFFNVGPREVADLLWEIKQHSTSPVLSGNEHKEKFCVHIQPNLANTVHGGGTTTTSSSSSPSSSTTTSSSSSSTFDNTESPPEIVTGDYCIVPELNMKAVDVISNVMAQSVALDSYNDTVDELLADFERINKAVVQEGNLATVDRDKLFKAVAANNSIFIEMVSKVGIKDRIDTAWNLSQYEDVSQGLIEEFDIEQRFEHIEFKLNLIQQNAKFFLEVLAHQKSNSLEWIIIVLIMFECVLMCMEMSGVGGSFFEYLGSWKPTTSLGGTGTGTGT